MANMLVPMVLLAVAGAVGCVAEPGPLPETTVAWIDEVTGASVVLSTDAPTIRLGEAIVVDLYLENGGSEPFQYDDQAEGEHDAFIIHDVVGNAVRYIELPYQTSGGSTTIRPGERTLMKTIDLTDKYLFEKPGVYTIQCQGFDRFPDSNELVVTVADGEVALVDQLIVRVLPLLPEGWKVAKSPREKQNVSKGWNDSAGDVVTLGQHLAEMRWHLVRLWRMDELVELAPAPNAEERKSAEPSVYLGSTDVGHIYVGFQYDPEFDTTWEDPVGTLSCALIQREQDCGR